MRYCMNHPLVETERYCTRCKKPVCGDCLVPLKGQEVCADCKHATLSAKFRSQPVHHAAAPGSWTPMPAPPPPISAPVAVPVESAVGEAYPSASPSWGAGVGTQEVTAAYAAPVLGNCSYHPNSPAYTTCERCGDFTCTLCVTAMDGRNYCVRCVDLMWQRGTLEASRFTDSRIAFGAGIISLFAWIVPFYGTIPGFIAFGLGIVAMRKIAAQPDLPGKNRAVAAVAMGLGSVLLSIGFWIWVFTRAFR